MIAYLTPVSYWLTLTFVCFYAFRYGGKDEYFGAMIFIIGSVLSFIAYNFLGSAWTGLTDATFLIDIIVLFAFIHLTLNSDRFWPMWATGFHLLTISVHVATSIAPDITPWALATGAAFWAYPMLFAMLLGVREYGAIIELSAETEAL